MSIHTESTTKPTGMPEGEELQRQVEKRHQRGQMWLSLFQIALISAIIALTVLIANIVNQTFGLVAIENEMDPGQLVGGHIEETMIAAPNTTTSEDDAALADAIATDPYAIGFFGYAFYQDQADRLRPLAIDGVEPSRESATDGSYELSRPLYLYTGESVLIREPQVTSFLDFYLQNVNKVIEEVGYFPISDDVLAEQDNALRVATGGPVSEGAVGDIVVSGSSTVYPLTVRLAEMFEAAGHDGTVTVESTGTKGGYAALCVDKTAAIADSSRAISRQESAACLKSKRTPVEIHVGADAIAVVVSSQNDFVRDVTQQEMQAIFTTAERWKNVRADWPDEPIVRHIPSLDSGTLRPARQGH